MKTFEMDDMIYDRESVGELRENLIQLRDSALSSGNMEWAVMLSHTIVVMSRVVEELES